MLKLLFWTLMVFFFSASGLAKEAQQGFFRQPTLHEETVVFVSEGDLWRVSRKGGVATRLTTHPGPESRPKISPDGKVVAFTAQYEGQSDVYTMPLQGGSPRRRTYGESRCAVAGFSPDGKLLCSTDRYSRLPDLQLFLLDLVTGERELIPLSQAAQGSFDDEGLALFFTRFGRQSSETKRYHGGTAENLWRFQMGGSEEAIPLLPDYTGTSSYPMWWNDRLYFLTDRDGTMNLWSMNREGESLSQHTNHRGWDVKSPSLFRGTAVYQVGADLYLYDLARGRETKLSISLVSDFDHLRERWVKKPLDYLTSAHPSPSGDDVVLTARGQIFVAPRQDGRFVEVTRKEGVRYRDARFLPDGKSLLAFSDESGEVELWTLPKNGVGERKQLTTDGKVLRWEAIPSPDGKWIAHHDKDWELWLLETDSGTQKKIDQSDQSRFRDLSWSMDGRWLLYVSTASNSNLQIKLHDVESGQSHDLTSDRTSCSSPAFDPKGEWIYFLSERNLRSVVRGPWGRRQPEPFFDRPTNIYQVSLRSGLQSPFAKDTELTAEKRKKKKEEEEEDEKEKVGKDDLESKEGLPDAVLIELEGIQNRVFKVPVSPGNYSGLMVAKDRLFWVALADLHKRDRSLKTLKIQNKDFKPKTLVEGVRNVELTANGKGLLVRKGSKIYYVDTSSGAPAKLDKAEIDLAGWTFSLDPAEEWRQMFLEAWRLERDYFYDRGMHGVNWKEMLSKYLPLVDRVRDRAELSDLVAQMVGELSALHIFVRGGDLRSGKDDVPVASLAVDLSWDNDLLAHRIDHIFLSDPDEIERRGPLAHPNLKIVAGDLIAGVNGVAFSDAGGLGKLLRNQAGKQVRLTLREKDGLTSRDVIVIPITQRAAADLRYHEWEYTRRLQVEKMSGGRIGYVHLRAMGAQDMAQWTRHFYPVFQREGLLIDVRHNRGGNIDSWILEKLIRKAWFYWQGRTGAPYWNMPYAFRGHMVTLCDERTASDGEAFSEGFRRLGLGKVLGTRTWGGEIWLTGSNTLVDRGVATAAEFGVYGPEGEWLIEGHGVDPDMVIDNLPHATFQGRDSQLEAGVRHLLELMEKEPVRVPSPPKGPDKSLQADGRPDVPTKGSGRVSRVETRNLNKGILMEERCRLEVKELHQFFEDWFTGKIEGEDHYSRFSKVMADGFEMISPEGAKVSRKDVLTAIMGAQGHLAGREFKIWIENHTSRSVTPDLELVTYEEWQENGGVRAGRLSTALMRRNDDAPRGVEWIHLHEVMISTETAR